MHIDNVIFLILSKNAYTKFSEGPILAMIVFIVGLAGLIVSISFDAPLFVLVLLGVFLLISAVSVYDTVHSKKLVIFKYLNKMSYNYETRVREEKIAEYNNILQSQNSMSEEEIEQLAGV